MNLSSVCFTANLLNDPFPRNCDVAFYDDSVFQHYYAQLEKLPTVSSIVILDISASRSSESKESINRKITKTNPSLFWHSSVHHFTASTMIMDFDSNGMYLNIIPWCLYKLLSPLYNYLCSFYITCRIHISENGHKYIYFRSQYRCTD